MPDFVGEDPTQNINLTEATARVIKDMAEEERKEKEREERREREREKEREKDKEKEKKASIRLLLLLFLIPVSPFYVRFFSIITTNFILRKI